jgi:phenylacetate-CoA ligase
MGQVYTVHRGDVMTLVHFEGKTLDNWIGQKCGLCVQSFTTKDIRGYQLSQLQKTIDYVLEKSPFYRKHLQGFQGARFETLEDPKKLPFTTAEDVRNFGLQMLCLSQSEIERVVTLDSSGTTGVPKRMYFTKEDQELTIDFFKQGMSTFTSPGERVLILLPGERPGGIGDLLAKAILQMGAIPIKYGIVHCLPETIESIAAFKPDVIVGIPIQVLGLAKFFERKGKPLPVSFNKILLSTDYVSQAIIEELHRIWGCEVYRYYGMSEMGLGGGIECRDHYGFHLYMGDFLFEIIDPDTGEILPDGQFGEVVFTTLTRKGMPLIRYRTGDLSRFIPQDCSCGSIIPRLENINSRKTGVIELDDFTLTMADLDEILLKLPGVIDFIATFSHKNNMPNLKIEIIEFGPTLEQSLVCEQLGQNKFIKVVQNKGILEVIQEFKIPEDYKPSFGKRTIKKADSRC